MLLMVHCGCRDGGNNRVPVKFSFKFIIYPYIDARFLRHVQLKNSSNIFCSKPAEIGGFFCVFVKSVFDIRYIRTVF